MKTTKRLLVLLLSLVITVTFMPVMAFAAAASGTEFSGEWDSFEPDAGVYMVETAGASDGTLEIDGTDTEYKTNDGGEKRTFIASVSGEGGNSSSVKFVPDEGFHLTTVQIRHEDVSKSEPNNVISENTYDYDGENKQLVNQADEHDVINIGQDNIYNISALPEYNKLWIGASFESDDPDVYETELLIDESEKNISILPGEEFVLKATLLRNGEPVDNVDRYELNIEENNVFDKNDAIVDYGDNLETGDGSWGCNAIPVFDDKNTDLLLGGHATFSVTAFAEGGDWTSNKVDIEVGCNLNYGNENIHRYNDGGRLEFKLLDIASEDDTAVTIDPSYGEEEKDPFNYNITLKNANGQLVDVSSKVTGNVLTLTKADVREIIKNTDAGFTVIVDAKGKEEIGEVENPIFCHDEIEVLVDVPNIYSECYMDFPSAIQYVSEQTVYDVDDFILKYKDSTKGTNPIPASANLYEWRFVNVDPDTLTPETPQETLDAANVLITEGADAGKLKLDHLGRYWVVAAGIGDYSGYIINSFVLTDADIYYTKAPQFNYDLQYNDGDPINLVSAGTLNNSSVATIQYKVDSGNWGTTIPTATNPGVYTVSFRAVDNSGNVVIAAESAEVHVNKKIIDLNLKTVTKSYGMIDDLTFDNLVENASDFSNEIKNNTVFTRERGEKAGDYRIYAIFGDDNYEAVSSDGCLHIEKADDYISVVDNVSFNVGSGTDSSVIPYYTDADNTRVKAEPCEESSGLNLTAADGILTISATKSCSEDVMLIVKGDDNHNGCNKKIHVEVTTSLTTGDAGSVDAKSNHDASLGANLSLSVQPSEIKTEDGRNESTVAIELKNNDETIKEFGGSSMVVKVKLTGELAGLADGSDPKVKYEGAEYNAWFEFTTDATYLCFETTHLSDWKLSAKPAIELNSSAFSLNIPESFDETGQSINFGNDVLTAKEGGESVNPTCYQLKFIKSGESKELDNVSEPGTYTAKVYAIKGMGYKDANTVLSKTFTIGAGSDHEHKFVTNKWGYNQSSHWKICDENGCSEIDAISMGGHVFDKKVIEEKYLVSAKTCTEYAKYYYSCECGAVGTETFSDVNSGFAGHNWDTAWTTDGTNHWHKCLNAGCAEKNESASHTGGTATCKAKAKCSICGAEYGSLAAHNLTHKAATAATETTAGNLEYWYCSVCKKYFKDAAATQLFKDGEWIIPATGGGGTVIPTEPTEPEIVVDPTSGGIIVDIGGEAKVEGDKASAVITTDTAKEIAEAAAKSGTTEIKLDATVKESVDKTELEIPMVIAETAKTNGASVEIATNVGSVVLDKQTVKGLAATDADSITVSVEKTKESGNDKAVFDITLTAVKDGQATTISKLQGTAQVVAPLPSGLKAEEACGLYLNGKLAEKVTTKVDGKNVVLTVKHFSTYGIMSNDEADKLFKTSAEATTMGKLTLKTYKGGKIKASWKNGIGNTGDITKYQVYYKQSGKKAKYTTTTSKSKTIKKLKKGKKYTVKTRAYIKINGKTYKSKWTSVKKIKCK